VQRAPPSETRQTKRHVKESGKKKSRGAKRTTENRDPKEGPTGASSGLFLMHATASGWPRAGRIWWPDATRLEDLLDISNGIQTPKSSGERDGVLDLA
jgi:hypothetical protein